MVPILEVSSTKVTISNVELWSAMSLIKTEQKMDQASSCEAALSQVATGAIFCLPRSSQMLANEVIFPPTSMVSQISPSKETSVPSRGDRSGKSNVFTTSPTLLRSLF